MQRLLIIFCLLTGVLWFAYQEDLRTADGRVHAFFIRAGSSDGILLRGPTGKTVLIDGGTDRKVIEKLGEHLPFLDRRVDLVILTHPVADRIGVLPEVLKRYHVRNILLSGASSTTPLLRELLTEMRTQKTPVLYPGDMQHFDLGDGGTVEILWPRESQRRKTTRNAQDGSIILRVQFHDRTMLITGDMRLKGGKALVRSGMDIHADVLQVSHLKTEGVFIDAVDPSFAIINTPISPRSVTMQPFLERGIPVRSSANEGVIELVLR